METKTHSPNTVADFKKGDTVVYVAGHKQATRTLDDCEPGRVTLVNDTYVFVQFMDKQGNYFPNSQACDPHDLWHRV